MGRQHKLLSHVARLKPKSVKSVARLMLDLFSRYENLVLPCFFRLYLQRTTLHKTCYITHVFSICVFARAVFRSHRCSGL